jgi:hypothetical protein
LITYTDSSPVYKHKNLGLSTSSLGSYTIVWIRDELGRKEEKRRGKLGSNHEK